MSDTPIYRIRVHGLLDTRWSDWLDGMTMMQDEQSNMTSFAGPVRDQAHLHGLIAQVRDAGLQLISVIREDEPA